MKLTTKSIIIGRKPNQNENEDTRPCFISFFEENNPHLSTKVPNDIKEFVNVHKVVIKGLSVNYLLPGNDIVINDLEELDIEIENMHNGDHLHITGKQNA